MANISFPDRNDSIHGSGAIFERLEARGGSIPYIYRILCHTPGIGNAMLDMSEAIRAHTVLDPELRELVILLTASFNGGTYEYANHRNTAIQLGIDRAKLDALIEFETSEKFSDAERAALGLARHLIIPPFELPAVSRAEVGRHFSEREIVELAILAGWYHLGTRLTAVVDLELDPWFQAL